MYLIDTNVISEARRGSPQATSWLRSVDPGSVHLSTLTLGEIMRGIASSRGPIQRRQDTLPSGCASCATTMRTGFCR